MEMKILPANGGGPGMDGVFLSGYGDGDYTPCPRSGLLPSLGRDLLLSIQRTTVLYLMCGLQQGRGKHSKS